MAEEDEEATPEVGVAEGGEEGTTEAGVADGDVCAKAGPASRRLRRNAGRRIMDRRSELQHYEHCNAWQSRMHILDVYLRERGWF